MPRAHVSAHAHGCGTRTLNPKPSTLNRDGKRCLGFEPATAHTCARPGVLENAGDEERVEDFEEVFLPHPEGVFCRGAMPALICNTIILCPKLAIRTPGPSPCALAPRVPYLDEPEKSFAFIHFLSQGNEIDFFDSSHRVAVPTLNTEVFVTAGLIVPDGCSE